MKEKVLGVEQFTELRDQGIWLGHSFGFRSFIECDDELC